MTLVTVRPARRTRVNMDRWLDELFHATPTAHARNRRNVNTRIPVNVFERDNAFHIQLAVPGMTKSDFDLKVEKDVLTISGKREEEAKEGETFRRREFGVYNFERSFRLPETVNSESIEASYVNGILDVTVPKVEEKQPRRIEIA